jgi:hypothetical protein
MLEGEPDLLDKFRRIMSDTGVFGVHSGNTRPGSPPTDTKPSRRRVEEPPAVAPQKRRRRPAEKEKEPGPSRAAPGRVSPNQFCHDRLVEIRISPSEPSRLMRSLNPPFRLLRAADMHPRITRQFRLQQIRTTTCVSSTEFVDP